VGFGICDAATTLLGPALALSTPEPPIIGTYFLCALLLGYAARWSRIVLGALTVLLSIDNVFGSAPASSALICGATSAALGLLGLKLASSARILVLVTLSRKVSIPRSCRLAVES
jgi:hypothetical protein